MSTEETFNEEDVQDTVFDELITEESRDLWSSTDQDCFDNLRRLFGDS